MNMDRPARCQILQSSECYTSTSIVSEESSPIRSIRQHLADQAVSEVGTPRLEQTKESVEQVNQNMSAALLDESAMDELNNSHLKSVDEAVSEPEVAVLRQQLEFAIQQNLAAEDRVSHLDGALKECMWQLRQLREEQEDKIHDAIAKHRREWEKLQSELEEKLEDMQHKYQEKDAENKDISKLLHNETEKIEIITKTRSQAQAEVIQLRKRLESMEKDNAALKVECTTIKEKQYSCDEKKSSNGRYWKLPKRQISGDSRKTTSKSGREWQIQQIPEKKVSTRGASEKAKPEIRSPQDKKRSSSSRSSKDVEKASAARSENEYQMDCEDIAAVQERLHAMEEETRRLKELLEKKDAELQHARTLGAEMADRQLSFKGKQERSYQGSFTTEGFVASSDDLANSSYGSDNSSMITHSQCNEMSSMFQNTEIKEIKLITSKLNSREFSCLHSNQFDMVSNDEQTGYLSATQTGNCSSNGTPAIDVVPELITTTGKLVETIQDLMSFSGIANVQDVPCVFWECPDFHAKMRAFMKLCVASLHEKTDLTKFTNCVSSLVEELGKVKVSSGGKDYESISLENREENPSCYNKHVYTPELTRMQEELRKVQGEKAALEAHMKVEFQRCHILEQDLVKLLDEKLDLDKKLQMANAELNQLKEKIFRLEQTESNLWDEFMSAKSSKQFIDEQLSGVSSVTEKSESQLKVIVVEWSRLQYRVGVLESEVRDKQHKNVLLEAKCQKLMDQLLRSSIVCSKCQGVNIDEETAVKVFERKGTTHWQTKLKLGKQFKALSLRRRQIKESSSCSREETMSMYGSSSTLPEEDEQEQKNKIRSLFKIQLRTIPARSKRPQRAKNEIRDSQRHASTSDILDWELTSLSKSGRPLGEFFGDKTPEHDHYIQVVEELTSSSDEECLSPLSVEQPAEVELPKKTRARSMDTTINGRHYNSFSKSFFSRQRKPHL